VPLEVLSVVPAGNAPPVTAYEYVGTPKLATLAWEYDCPTRVVADGVEVKVKPGALMVPLTGLLPVAPVLSVTKIL
jgi:hypothetical protein